MCHLFSFQFSNSYKIIKLYTENCPKIEFFAKFPYWKTEKETTQEWEQPLNLTNQMSYFCTNLPIQKLKVYIYNQEIKQRIKSK